MRREMETRTYANAPGSPTHTKTKDYLIDDGSLIDVNQPITLPSIIEQISEDPITFVTIIDVYLNARTKKKYL